jgi:hypothetical protein
VNSDATVVVRGKESRKIMMGRSADVTGSDKLTVKGSASIKALSLTITAPTITLNAGIVKVSGVLQCSSVVSPSYSPGAGNTM